MHNFFVLVVFILQLSSCRQTGYKVKLFTQVVVSHPVSLGDSTLTIQVSIYDSAINVAFVHLHDDEQTAKQVTQSFLERNGGTLISIPNNGHRLINFPIGGKRYTFDPNRMFTRKGLVETLKLFQPNSRVAIPEIERLANFFLQKIPEQSYVIAMHNNTDKKYTVHSYLPHGTLPKEASKVFINKAMDPDDFVFTTDAHIFSSLQNRVLNAVLQRKKPGTDDGSLSILFGLNNKSYINIEAEHGHYEEQLRMLEEVADIITVKNNIPYR